MNVLSSTRYHIRLKASHFFYSCFFHYYSFNLKDLSGIACNFFKSFPKNRRLRIHIFYIYSKIRFSHFELEDNCKNWLMRTQPNECRTFNGSYHCWKKDILWRVLFGGKNLKGNNLHILCFSHSPKELIQKTLNNS